MMCSPGIVASTLACVLAGSSLLPRVARAESPRFYELEGFGHFLDGNPETTAVTEEGAVALPPEVKERFSDAAVTFSAATPDGDEIVVARLDDAQVSAIDAAGHVRKIFKPDESLVTGLLATPAGLWVAVGPPAKIYLVDKSGKSKVVYTPEASYVWSMTGGPNGSMYVATGEPGTVVNVDQEGHGKVIFHPEQAHLRSLAYDPKLGLFVGGGERGVLYRAAHLNARGLPSGDDGFRALYDTGNPEITALLVRDGAAYVAGVAGAAALVADEGGKHGGSAGGPGPAKGADVHSQVMRINMDGTSEVLAGSNDEAVFAMAFDNQGNVIVATGATGRDDPRGRVYSIDVQRRVISMLYQSPSRRITHLLNLPNHALAAVSAAGCRITQLTGVAAKQGEFVTQPFDAGINARFGLVQVLGMFPKGTAVQVAARTGQTGEPDATWSSWSKAVLAPGNKALDVANGRYLQVRLTLQSDGQVTPLVQRVRVAYLRQNLPPFVREVTALHKGVALLPLPREEAKAKTVSLTDKPDDARDDSRRTQAPRARQVPDRGALTLKWVADDPNGDELRYDLLMRSANDATWHLIKGDLEDPFYTFKSSQLPDGHYLFRVRASDAYANPAGLERSDERESRAVLVDNTPPRVADMKVSGDRRSIKIRTSVADAVGPLVELTYALDSAEARPILPDDGLLDGPTEDITLELHNLSPGAHALTIRAVDEADNEGFGEVRFDVK